MLQELIDGQLKLKRDEEKKTRGRLISPSSLGGCLRKGILMERGAEGRPFDERTLRVFKAGYLFEAFVMDTLRATGHLVAEQKPVEWRGMKGTLDGLVRYDGKVHIMDCKSVHSGKFDWLDREGVSESYQLQLAFYWRAVKESGEFDNLADTGIIFYIEKECLLVKEMPVDCAGIQDKVESKLAAIEEARSKDELPPEKAERDWECFSVQKSRHKVPRPIGCKVWCNMIDHCPRIKAELIETENEIRKNQEVQG